MKIVKDNSGATALEFAFIFPAVVVFILGIMHVTYALWIDNLTHYAVDSAARCGAIYQVGISVPSYPCACPTAASPCTSTTTDMMLATATSVLSKGVIAASIPSTTFVTNTSCTGSGLSGSYTVGFLKAPSATGYLSFLATAITVNAKSCYPNYS
jgi:Flp pilus assembly protein TadG